MSRLHIYDPRERRLVGAANIALSTMAAVTRPFRRRRRPEAPTRILLLRLERIGDLLMTVPAIADVRALAPNAEIHLIVGSWNGSLAAAIPGVSSIEPLDASWLSRGQGGRSIHHLLKHARRWRAHRYDLAINFEPDIRSNLLLAASGASWSAGYASGGGGALLDQALDFDPRAHTTDNARRLIATIFDRRAQESPADQLRIPDTAIAKAAARLSRASAGPVVGIHVSGGRSIKQWEPPRFAEVARRLAAECGATIVLTGEGRDRPLVDVVRAGVPERQLVDSAGDVDLLELAAMLQQLDVFVTGDTGPMHLAAAVGTPVVAIFGPSDPARYAPRGPSTTVVRVDLPCSPCNRIRLPPARCVGHTPDCLAGIDVEKVYGAVEKALDRYRQPRIRSGSVRG